MVVMLPNLIILFVFPASCKMAKQLQQPFPSAFWLCFILQIGEHLTGHKRFPVPHHLLQPKRLLATRYQMQMIGHDGKSVYLKSLVRLTITPTVQYHISIYLPYKQIHPARDRASEVVQPVLIPNFVLYAHVLYLGM
jgi:hypothetical protein